jgi:hypothetical protein
MQDPAWELRRITIPRTPVNKGYAAEVRVVAEPTIVEFSSFRRVRRCRSLLRTLGRGTTVDRLFRIPGRSLITPRPDIHGSEESNANILVVFELSVVCGQRF